MPALVHVTKAPAGASTHAPLVRRKCACGGSAGVDDHCDECRAERLQRSALPLRLGSPDDPLEAEADRVAAQVVAGGSPTAVGHDTGATLRRTLACPPRLAPDAPVPTGWKPYYGNSAVFHCGFRGILEDRTPSQDNPQQECFYDHSGALVDENHRYAGCRGTPNYNDSSSDWIGHTFSDPGGIWQAGNPAFWESRRYDIDQAISAGIRATFGVLQTAADIGSALVNALGEAIALSIMTGAAIVHPPNWTFHGMPARARRHLNVMGALLSSVDMAGDVTTLMRNLTRRLDSFGVPDLLREIAEDVNAALQAAGSPHRLTAADVGAHSMLHFVQALEQQGLLSFRRPPAEHAREMIDQRAREAAGR